jgi:hypothetical protein
VEARPRRGLDLDAEDFAASVERDLEQLPTLDESDRFKH